MERTSASIFERWRLASFVFLRALRNSVAFLDAMNTFHKKTIILIGGLLLFIAGCGGDGLVKIEGRVAYDGQPVERGVIKFFPIDGAGPTAAAIIANGVYQVRIPPGSKRVQIEGFRVVGRHRDNLADPKSPLLEDLEQMLPAKYNTKTELTADVQRRVMNRCSFDLNSKPTSRQ
jgi:hypothetical protein